MKAALASKSFPGNVFMLSIPRKGTFLHPSALPAVYLKNSLIRSGVSISHSEATVQPGANMSL